MLRLHFTPFPELTTERLVLRQLCMEDASEIFVLRSDDRVNQFLDRPKASSIEDARNFISKINKGIDAQDGVYWAVALKHRPSLIGTICYWNISQQNLKAEIGYELLPPFQGKGIMQEALSKVIAYGFETMELQTIEACLNMHNSNSIKLLEKNKFKRDEQNRNEKEINMLVYLLHNAGKSNQDIQS